MYKWLYRAQKWGLFKYTDKINYNDLNICNNFIAWLNQNDVKYEFIDAPYYKNHPGYLDFYCQYDYDTKLVSNFTNIKIFIALQNNFIPPLAIIAHEISHLILHKVIPQYNNFWLFHNEDGVNALASHLIGEFLNVS